MTLDDNDPGEELLLDDPVEDGQQPPDPEGEEDIGFGDDPIDEDSDDAGNLPRKLRHEIRERDRKLAAATRELEELRAKAKPAPVEVGPRPKLADFDYDEDKWEVAVDQWSDRKAEAALAQSREGSSDDKVQQEFMGDLQRFQEQRAELRYPDAKDAMDAATAALTEAQQVAIVQVAQDSAKLLYALGRHPEKLRTLAAIANPAKFIGEVARLEMMMKPTRRNSPPAPDRPVRGDATPRSGDKELERLQREADRTGKRTALIRYKREKGLL